MARPWKSPQRSIFCASRPCALRETLGTLHPLRPLVAVAFLAPMLVATLAATKADAAPTNAGRGNEDAAKAAFARGIRLSEDGQYEAARIEFERSLELKPTRSAAVNRAVCLRHLGRFEEALTAIRLILKEKNLPKGERESLEREASSMEDLFGTLTVIAPPDTTILVDDVEKGAAPLKAPLAIGTGVHIVAARRNGAVVASARVSIAAHTTRELVLTAGVSADEKKRPEVVAPTKVSPPSRPSVAPWVLGGVGIAALATGGVLFVVRDQNARDTRDAIAAKSLSTSDFESRRQRNDALRLAAQAATVGGALAVGGAALWIGLRSGTSTEKETAISCSPSFLGGVAVGCQGTF